MKQILKVIKDNKEVYSKEVYFLNTNELEISIDDIINDMIKKENKTFEAVGFAKDYRKAIAENNSLVEIKDSNNEIYEIIYNREDE